MSLWPRITNVFRRDCLTRELDADIESHIQEAVEHGRDPVEARRSFGSKLRRRQDSDRGVYVCIPVSRRDAATASSVAEPGRSDVLTYESTRRHGLRIHPTSMLTSE